VGIALAGLKGGRLGEGDMSTAADELANTVANDQS